MYDTLNHSFLRKCQISDHQVDLNVTGLNMIKRVEVKNLNPQIVTVKMT